MAFDVAKYMQVRPLLLFVVLAEATERSRRARRRQDETLTLEAAGWMEVDADAAAMKDNIALSAEAIKNKLTGQ